jgi:hypothetical protein
MPGTAGQSWQRFVAVGLHWHHPGPSLDQSHTMSQTSEESLPESAAASGAQILTFDRQSALQRAVQLRARDTMEKQRSRREFAPVRWGVIFLLALVPVGMMLGALDGFLRAIQM